MKQLKIANFPVAHSEVTLGLRLKDGTQYTTRDVTIYLQKLNRQLLDMGTPQMTFKVFSGYAPYLRVDPDKGAIALADSVPLSEIAEEITENVALVHLDYNPYDHGEERFEILTWYVGNLMEQFEQSVAYAHASSTGGHEMLVFSLVDEEEKEPAN